MLNKPTNAAICKYCGGETKHRDYVKRKKILAYGEVTWVKLERVKCTNCGRIMRVLDDLMPFKHYSKNIYDEMTSGEVDPYDLRYEDYPSECTKKRWNRV